MSSKFDFISNIDNPKKQFWLYEAVLGFEKISVLIPIDRSDEFENAVNNEKPKSITGIKKIAQRFGGDTE